MQQKTHQHSRPLSKTQRLLFATCAPSFAILAYRHAISSILSLRTSSSQLVKPLWTSRASTPALEQPWIESSRQTLGQGLFYPESPSKKNLTVQSTASIVPSPALSPLRHRHFKNAFSTSTPYM